MRYPELVQDLMDLGLLPGGCMILDGDIDVTPIPLLVDREATMVVEVGDHHRTPAMRLRTVLRNGFLVETRLRWETLPPWPERMQKARRLTDIDTEMTGHAARGRSVVIETGPPERVLARHRDHVLAVSREQVSSPVELTTVDDALNSGTPRSPTTSASSRPGGRWSTAASSRVRGRRAARDRRLGEWRVVGRRDHAAAGGCDLVHLAVRAGAAPHLAPEPPRVRLDQPRPRLPIESAL